MGHSAPLEWGTGAEVTETEDVEGGGDLRGCL